MRAQLSEYSTAELAFATGHKLTNIHRFYAGVMLGHVYFASLDGSKPRRVTEIRHQLEAEYRALEAKQGTPKINT